MVLDVHELIEIGQAISKKKSTLYIVRLPKQSDSRIIRNAVMRDRFFIIFHNLIMNFHYILRAPLHKSDRLAVKPNSPHKHRRQSRKIPDVQTANGVVVSDTLVKFHIEVLWRFHSVHLANNSPSLPSLGRPCSELVYSIRGRQQDFPDYLKGRVIECSIGNCVFMVAVTKRSVVPSIESSLAKDDTMLELVTEGSKEDDASSSVSPAGQLHACCPGETF